MYFITTMLSLFSSLTFTFMHHPLTMGLILLIQTLLVSFIAGFLSKTFWFSYILFIVFLGGMLVLFLYVTALASNEMFSMSLKIFQLLIMTVIASYLILFLLDNFFINSFFNTMDMTTLPSVNSFIKENTINLNKLYNFPTNFLTILLINYLFLTLIAVVKVTDTFRGPLRSQN